jgi:DNA replication protein DnaC
MLISDKLNSKNGISHTNGGFVKLLQQLMQVDLLILDDFGITPIGESHRHDLLTIIDDRYRLKSTIFTSQLPVKSWHTYLGEPTVADAILDRVLSQSNRVELQGKSLRWKDVALDETLCSTKGNQK